MRSRTIIAALTIAILTTVSFAQMFGPKFWGPPIRLYEELKLTDEQRTKLQNLSLEFQKKQADVSAKLNKARIELEELLLADKPDKSAINKKIDEISGYTKEMAKNRMEHWFEIQQILTPEQRKILREKFGYFGDFGRWFRGWAKPGRGLRLHRCW